MARRGGVVLELILVLRELALGDAERLVDGVVQIGRLEFALQVIRLVRHHDVVVAGQADLDPHHRRNGVARVVGALIDAHAAGRQAIVDALPGATRDRESRSRPSRISGDCGRRFRPGSACLSSKRCRPGGSTPGPSNWFRERNRAALRRALLAEHDLRNRCPLSGSALPEPAVAVLVLLARAARAGVVAADLAPGGRIVRIAIRHARCRCRQRPARARRWRTTSRPRRSSDRPCAPPCRAGSAAPRPAAPARSRRASAAPVTASRSFAINASNSVKASALYSLSGSRWP